LKTGHPAQPTGADDDGHVFNINADTIAQLPDGAIIINIARGDLVDDDALIAALESAVTLVSAAHISRAGSSDVVTASAEQMPRTCSVTGLLSTIGSTRTLRVSLIASCPPRSGAN